MSEQRQNNQRRRRGRNNNNRGGNNNKTGGNRPNNRNNNRGRRSAAKPKKLSFGQKLLSILSLGLYKPVAHTGRPKQLPRMQSEKADAKSAATGSKRPRRAPEKVEVTNSRLYVGNLSYDATESDLFELFNGVGLVKNAEVVTNQRTQRSKGYAFVSMQSIDEAKRAVAELHDKDYMGRPLVVSGAKSEGPHQSNLAA